MVSYKMVACIAHTVYMVAYVIIIMHTVYVVAHVVSYIDKLIALAKAMTRTTIINLARFDK